MADVVMPQLGESVTEGTITKWFKQVGEHVAEDETLFEVSTDKVDSEVPSPASGYVSEIRVPEGETVDVGTVLVVLSDQPVGDGATAAPAEPPAEAPAAPDEPVAPAPAAPPAPAAVAQPAVVPPPAPPAPAAPSGAAPVTSSAMLSPLVRRLVDEHGLDPATIVGTGVGGRITRDDVLAIIDARAGAAPQSAPTSAASPAASPAVASPAAAPATTVVAARGDAAIPFSNIRRRTGEHMVMSKAVSPHVITAIEVDYERVERARRSAKDAFKAEEGFSLTYLPFIARATVDALADYPNMNATVSGDSLLVHGEVNLSIAVDINFEGLLAPVVKQADSKRMRAIAREISDLADRARTKRLAPDDLAGGTFTLSNSGSFGTLFVAPIINQPQVAIMSTDGIRRRPVVVDVDGTESIAIHSVGVLTLSWDHRAFDGAYAAAFMRRVKEILETRDWAAEL